MCGNFGIFDIDKLADRFDLSNQPETSQAAFKISPTATVATISRNSPNKLVYHRWWLAPPWVDDPYKVKFPTFNARAETVDTKPAFRHAWKHAQRCLIPANYFVEWQTVDDPDNPKKPLKLPYRVQLKGGGLFGFAGLYEVWKDAEDVPVETCTIITTEPNKLLSQIHDRQPVMLEPENEATWLDPETDPDIAYKLLKPLPESKMEMFRIDQRFNKTKAPEVTKEMVQRAE